MQNPNSLIKTMKYSVLYFWQLLVTLMPSKVRNSNLLFVEEHGYKQDSKFPPTLIDKEVSKMLCYFNSAKGMI